MAAAFNQVRGSSIVPANISNTDLLEHKKTQNGPPNISIDIPLMKKFEVNEKETIKKLLI